MIYLSTLGAYWNEYSKLDIGLQQTYTKVQCILCNMWITAYEFQVWLKLKNK